MMVVVEREGVGCEWEGRNWVDGERGAGWIEA